MCELPDIQFMAHTRSQISKPMPLRNWLLTNRDPFKSFTLLSSKCARVSDISQRAFGSLS